MLIKNFDLLSIGIAAAGIAILAAVVFLSNKRSATNQAFVALSTMTILWSGLNYFSYQPIPADYIIWVIRYTIFCAVWNSFFVFQLFYIFPKERFDFSKQYKYLLIPAVSIISLLTLSPFVFNRVLPPAYEGGAVSIVPGKGIVLFGLTVVGLVLGGIFFLLKKTIAAKDLEKKQYKFILLGSAVSFFLIILFNLVLPSFFSNSQFVQYGALFTFPFIFLTAYAIIKHHLLDIKVVTTEILTFILSAVSLFEVLLSTTVLTIIFRLGVFVLVLFFGIFLIKSVRKEIEQRTKLENLTKELQVANIRLKELDQQKTDFLSIAAHQLRTPLSILNGYIELIKDGAYGKVHKETKEILDNMDSSNLHLVKLVDEFLDISRLEQGRTKYDFKEKDVVEIIDGVVKEQALRAEQKGLKLGWKKPARAFKATLDDEKVRHVIYNFVDNAIKYSEHGTIAILIDEEEKGIAVRVKDHGFGFDKNDEANFFQKFYRGNNVKGTEVNGTGLGLYVCKKFIEGHKGKIWADSEGLGKGGEFGFWIPQSVK